MGETIKIRALFCKLEEEDTPILVAAQDRSIWEHDDSDTLNEPRAEWPEEYDWREAWLHVDAATVKALFATTDIPATVGDD